MARKKKYNEDLVLEKAMLLFWRNGYETTTMQMLEQEMGINKFSIYASFGSKYGLFRESLKKYKKTNKAIFEELKNSTNGLAAIKTFFYNSVNLRIRKEKGCLVTNTYYEFANQEDQLIKEEMTEFMNNLKALFIEKLSINTIKDKDEILKQANFLLLAKHGLAKASKVNSPQEIEDYIEMTFKNL
ncbi:DNA-binding transcriptional regulator, AcrR family [Tenacibaculum sp. MAR_2009_124]|uniref:TetR/AcrR family transcriptional regulator n=1 Tax=Tenacibaculum sp. MAR_2009_124 TaxID=1250059 RepID=UPI0008978D8C|nr:TetR/AcrR family transcriptional regulator [Tenacibaculum sp. MAR_2009_124]SEB87209.1 DNA-binding transcriptional regulator, AcrR family [Tenacibaculum sp. MAR_2009_124]